MRSWLIGLVPELVVSGCATPSQVQQMIDDNNNKIVAEQLTPEFDRINELLAAVEASTQKVAGQLTVFDAEQQNAAGQLKSLSLALNKTQSDMGLINEKIAEVKTFCKDQQEDVDAAVTAVKSQKEALLNVFQKQMEDLAAMIEMLESEGSPDE